MRRGSPDLRNFYPRPPRGGRPSAFPPGRPGCRISIHALREEGDGFLAKMQTSRPYFYPRPPRGGRPYAGTPYHLFGRFLSTPSARRATEGDFLFIGWCCNFYPRPPRGGRLLAFCLGFGLSIISIHALREEGDPAATPSSTGRYDFYPRPPRGGRLVLGSVLVVAVIISIHALREEGDVPQTYRRSCPTDFYPRPPRGGRRIRGLHARGGLIYFYPRPPRGGRRHHRAADHAGRNFYPRPPRGGRPILP